MAQVPHTERKLANDLSVEEEDGDSTDMGYDPNEDKNTGCFACSPCCQPSKNLGGEKSSN